MRRHDDNDRRWFLRLFDAAVTKFSWTCHAYCLMGNHVHLLIELQDETLSEGMQWLLGRYAQDFNWRHGYDGHLFQGRFKSETVDSNWHLLELSRYIVLNPVRAEMCDRADQWPWSSYCESVGLVPTRAADPRRLLRYFGGSAGRAEAHAAEPGGGLPVAHDGRHVDNSRRGSRA